MDTENLVSFVVQLRFLYCLQGSLFSPCGDNSAVIMVGMRPGSYGCGGQVST